MSEIRNEELKPEPECKEFFMRWLDRVKDKRCTFETAYEVVKNYPVDAEPYDENLIKIKDDIIANYMETVDSYGEKLKNANDRANEYYKYKAIAEELASNLKYANNFIKTLPEDCMGVSDWDNGCYHYKDEFLEHSNKSLEKLEEMRK